VAIAKNGFNRIETLLFALMSGHIFKIGVANQANPKMQNNGGQQNRDPIPVWSSFFCPPFFRLPGNVS
jgi:hypothetical protein